MFLPSFFKETGTAINVNLPEGKSLCPLTEISFSNQKYGSLLQCPIKELCNFCYILFSEDNLELRFTVEMPLVLQSTIYQSMSFFS